MGSSSDFFLPVHEGIAIKINDFLTGPLCGRQVAQTPRK